MALSKGHLLVLCVLLLLSLAQLALAHYSWHSDEDDWYNNFQKPKALDGGKKASKKHSSGFYNGQPLYDVDDEEVDDGGYTNDGAAPPPPVYKKKPSKPAPKPVYYKPKPAYTKTKPNYTKPIYTQPSPAIKPSYKKKTPSSYYKNPAPAEYVPPQQPAPTVPYNTPAPTPPYTPAPAPPTYTSPVSSSSEQAWLDPHNAARAAVGEQPLVWSDEVAQFAQSWANQRQASGCDLQHSDGPYGENIFWGSAGGYGPAECVAAWVSEKQYYNYADNSCAGGQDCGHYTQVVWASSVRLGCAKVQCDSGAVFMTCNYDPPGNYIGTKPY